MTARRTIAAIAFALTVPGATAAQATAEAFEAQTRAAVPGAGNSYGLIRCAAFFRSIAMAIGPEILGPERTAGIGAVEQRFGVAAAIIRMDEDADLGQEAAIGLVLDDIEAVAPLYLERYAANRAARGHSWSGDEVLAGDRTRCETLLNAMQ